MKLREDMIRFFYFCRYLKINPSISSVYNRIRLQKIFYILKKFDLDLNFKFNWYAHGPYSPDLADVYYYAKDYLNSIEENQSYFNYSEKLKLNNAKKFLESIKNNSKLLEYYASLVFVHNDMIFRKDERNQETYENRIKKSKPGLYYKFNYKDHISNLKHHGLIKS